MSNPNQGPGQSHDPNAGRPEETLEMRDEARAMNHERDVQAVVDQGVPRPFAEQMVDTRALLDAALEQNALLKHQKESLQRENTALGNRVGGLQEARNDDADRLKRSKRWNMILGGVAVLATGVAVAFGIGGGKDRAADSTPTATHTTTQAPAGQAPAPKTPPAPKTSQEKLQDRINYADEAKTVAGAVARAHPTSGTVNEMIRQMIDGEKVKIPDHRGDAWGSLASRIKTSDVTAPQGKLGIALDAEASEATADATANILNHKDPMTPNPMSHKEALESIVHDLTHTADSKIETVSGKLNHGFDGNNVYRAGDSGKIRVVSFVVDGIREYFKVVCLNGQWGLVKTAPPVKTPQSQQPQGGGEKKAPQPKEQEKKQPQGGGKTGQTQKKVTPKHDPKTTPAGVPGEPGGHPTGVVEPVRPKPEVDPPNGPTQPQEQTPAPLPNSPAPTGPAETGTPTTAPQEPAQGSETPAPTTDPNPAG